MKKILIYTILLVVSFSAYASASRWEAGNKAYIEGNYEKAVEEYNAIIEGGEYSMKLYYNLANAYFKQGETAKAILYYNKALRLAPSQEDIRHNLAIAEAQTKDRIAVIPEFFLNRWLRIVRNSMSCMAWSVLSLVTFAIVLVFGLLFLLDFGVCLAVPARFAHQMAQNGLLLRSVCSSALCCNHRICNLFAQRYALARRGCGYGIGYLGQEFARPFCYRFVRSARGYKGTCLVGD